MVNTFIVADEESREAAVFDPGGDADKIIAALEEDGLKLKYIINTHTHFDHTGGNKQLQAATGAPILTHRDEAPNLQDANKNAAMYGVDSDDSEASQFIEEGDELEVGSIRFQILALPGHSPAGLGFVFQGELEMEGTKQMTKMVICGDILFAGSIGRTDLPGGDMELLLENVRTKIFPLPDETLVLSGHGPVTTVGREKKTNPFFQGQM